MSETTRRFCGFVVGAAIVDDGLHDGYEWPDLPQPTEGPRWMSGDGWIGCLIAVDSDAAAEVLRCETFGSDGALPVEEDAIREYFDVSASDAQEAWDAYAETCVAAGFGPGRGEVLFVMGRLP